MTRTLSPEQIAVIAAELRDRDKKLCAKCGHRMTNHRAWRPKRGDPFPCSECDCDDYTETDS